MFVLVLTADVCLFIFGKQELLAHQTLVGDLCKQTLVSNVKLSLIRISQRVCVLMLGFISETTRGQDICFVSDFNILYF